MAGGMGANVLDRRRREDAPPGLPAWMATFADLVTLLLTFFVLLLSFAKTESNKYEAALGSIRDAFGGNVLQAGQVIQRGKSPDDMPTLMDSQEPIRPFPIEYLTTEGLLDKHEINRNSTEDLNDMGADLRRFDLLENVDVHEMPEGVKAVVKDRILFKEGSVEPNGIAIEVYDKLVRLLSERDWTVFVMGHAGPGESSADGSMDPLALSAARAAAVTKSLVRRGVRKGRITTVFHGDARPSGGPRPSRRVEFIIRKTDLSTPGRLVTVP